MLRLRGTRPILRGQIAEAFTEAANPVLAEIDA